MFIHSEKLFKELENQLKSISLEQSKTLSLAELSSEVCDQYLMKLKGLLINSKFKNESDEIYFFKKVKPKFTSKLYYFILLYDLEKKRIHKDSKSQQEYLETCLRKVDMYFQENLEFCTYYRTDNSMFDDKYFVQDKININFAHSNSLFNYERGFSTNRDSHVAQIMANDLLTVYIVKELEKLDLAKNWSKPIYSSNLFWADTKASLVLLIYALHSAGNFGSSIDLKEIANTLSKTCNVELGDIYRTWAEIKLKKDPTKFFDTLKSAVLNRINNDLE